VWLPGWVKLGRAEANSTSSWGCTCSASALDSVEGMLEMSKDAMS